MVEGLFCESRADLRKIRTKERVFVAKIINIFSSADDEMKDYERKIWKHKMAVYLRYAVLVLLVIAVIAGIRYYVKNRSFSDYSISETTERKDTLTTKYASFGRKILKYSRDGVSYTDEKDKLLFSITYTMQDPMLVLNEKAGAVAERNGNQIYTFNQIQQTGKIETLLPIKHLAISEQGVVAVLMEESSASKLEIYASDGTLLGDGKFTLEDAGYPMNLTISSDGTKIAIAFAQVSGTKFESSVAVYNFDSVGENHVDHLVFAQNYTDYLIPEIHYFNNSTFAAVGDGILAIYQGTQIPEQVKELSFEKELLSVFYGKETIGLVLKEEQGQSLQIFDLKGNQAAEIPFDMNYDQVYIEDEWVLIYNGNEMGLYNFNGKECFRQTFETSVTDIFTTNSRRKYLLIYNNETQKMKLQ